LVSVWEMVTGAVLDWASELMKESAMGEVLGAKSGLAACLGVARATRSEAGWVLVMARGKGQGMEKAKAAAKASSWA